MGTFRFIGATPGNVLVSNYTLVMVEKFGGGAAGWKTTAIIFAVIGLAVNTISVFFKDLPEEELMDGIKVSAIINLGFFLINLVSTSFGMKVGGGIGSALSGWLLAAAKFDASALTQSAGCSNMLTFMFAGIPVIITAIIVFIYFKIDVEKANTKLRAEKDLALN